MLRLSKIPTEYEKDLFDNTSIKIFNDLPSQ